MMCVGDGLAMDEAWPCNGLDFLIKQSPKGWGAVLQCVGALSCGVCGRWFGDG